MARGGLREALEVFFLGPREAKALLGVSDLWRVELRYWWYYWPRVLSLDIWLQGQPLRDRPFGDFRFGETPYFTALEILKEARLEPGETLYDMGSGRGKMVFTAALAFRARAVGVELLTTYQRFARKIQKALRLEREVEFRLDDFTLVEVFDADVVYIAGSIFESDTRAELLALVDQLQPGSRWISVGWASEHPLLELESARERLFSWGFETVYQYRVLVEAADQFHPAIGEEMEIAGAPADAVSDQAHGPQQQVDEVLGDQPADPLADVDPAESAPVLGSAVQTEAPP